MQFSNWDLFLRAILVKHSNIAHVKLVSLQNEYSYWWDILHWANLFLPTKCNRKKGEDYGLWKKGQSFPFYLWHNLISFAVSILCTFTINSDMFEILAFRIQDFEHPNCIKEYWIITKRQDRHCAKCSTNLIKLSIYNNVCS